MGTFHLRASTLTSDGRIDQVCDVISQDHITIFGDHRFRWVFQAGLFGVSSLDFIFVGRLYIPAVYSSPFCISIWWLLLCSLLLCLFFLDFVSIVAANHISSGYCCGHRCCFGNVGQCVAVQSLLGCLVQLSLFG